MVRLFILTDIIARRADSAFRRFVPLGVTRAWAEKHNLEFFTRYHETEVRTVFVQGTYPERGQIWIDPPAPDGTVTVHAAVYRKHGKDNQKTELSANGERLETVLDETYAKVVGWLGVSS